MSAFTAPVLLARRAAVAVLLTLTAGFADAQSSIRILVGFPPRRRHRRHGAYFGREATGYRPSSARRWWWRTSPGAGGQLAGQALSAELGQREAAYREVWARIIRDSGHQPQ